VTVVISKRKTTLTYSGDTSGQYTDKPALKATLLDELNQPVANKTITFQIGSLTATATTNASGVATSSAIQLGQPATTLVSATFNSAGDVDYTGTGGNPTASDSKTFMIDKEDASMDYTGDTIGLTGSNANLRVTVWDSAATGYTPGPSNTGPAGDTTIGDITKMYVEFDIYTATSCGTGTPSAVRTAQVLDTGTAGDGIGTASATYTSTSEASYCVMTKLIGGSGGIAAASTTNAWYQTDPPTAVVITFYNNTGQFVTGGGWIWDPAGGGNKHGNFGFNARYNKSGSPQGQMVYVYRGLYPAVGGVPADYRIKSNSLNTLAFSCWDANATPAPTWTSCPLNNTMFPARATLTGKSTIQINRASDGYVLYSDGNSTFGATVTDSGASSGIGSDSYQLTVYDKNAVLYKSVPTALLQGGNVVIHGGK
jgi:hypothetical protein